MLASGSVYQTELGRINIQIDHCEANIRRLEREIDRLENALGAIEKEYSNLEEHELNFRNTLCEVEHWNSLMYWQYVDKVKDTRKIFQNYNREVKYIIKKIKRKITSLEERIGAEKSKLIRLKNRKDEVRMKLEKANKSRNSHGSVTY